ncbi:succinylglutamate desuccinylase/aspartoacylase family protein [Marinobacter sp. SBS5]|uniref:succinylglutamate desuccinylase/aspartoacylase family protein n=1 Tax=Marinobacter sp. SBS5 TaxID=3401754 RepID=UPI003AAF27FE
MLFQRHHHRTTHTMLAGFFLALAPFSALADNPNAQAVSETPEPLVAQLAEDESVEDVVHSEPRRDTQKKSSPKAKEPAQPEAKKAAKAGKQSTPTSEPNATKPKQPRKIAPNVDLKEVAPMPEPEPEPAPEPVQDDATTTGTAEPQEQTPPAEGEPEMAEAEPIPSEAFTLLGNEVLPGTSTRLAWTPNIQIAGLSQTTPVLVVNGAHAGPTLCLTGAIHGDELNGIEIVRRAMYDLDPAKLSGQVVGVPIVNLTGFQQGSRYLPDRRDLNRYFPGRSDGTLADRIAHSLFNSVIRHCDMLVDIHTGSLKRTNLPQLRADMNNPEVAEFTKGFDRMAVVHSSGSEGMLRTAAVNAGIRAVTLEAGESLRIQEHQIKAGVNSLNSLMEKHGMISRMFVWGDPQPVYYDSLWIRAQHGGILFSEVELGDRISEGQILGYVADPITNEQYPIRSNANGRVIGMAVDQVVMAGFAAYHIGTEAEVPGE